MRKSKLKVLVIEDNRLLREGITAILNREPDFRTISAGDVESAVRKPRAFRPDVVLVDLSLSEVNPAELIEKLRRRFPGCRLAAMDLVPAPEEIAELVARGISGFILKYATAKDFITAIRTIASGHIVLPRTQTESLFSQITDREIHRSGNGRRASEMVRMTRREREIIAQIAKGLSNKEIATELNIAVHTVKSHVHNILDKLALRTRLEIATMALNGESVDLRSDKELRMSAGRTASREQSYQERKSH